MCRGGQNNPSIPLIYSLIETAIGLYILEKTALVLIIIFISYTFNVVSCEHRTFMQFFNR